MRAMGNGAAFIRGGAQRATGQAAAGTEADAPSAVDAHDRRPSPQQGATASPEGATPPSAADDGAPPLPRSDASAGVPPPPLLMLRPTVEHNQARLRSGRR